MLRTGNTVRTESVTAPWSQGARSAAYLEGT